MKQMLTVRLIMPSNCKERYILYSIVSIPSREDRLITYANYVMQVIA